MNITFKQVEAFLAVARTLNFSRAAGLVHLSQPALSANIRRLEEVIGARLFDRDTRTVALSAAGVEFFNIATELIENAENGLARIRDFASGKHRILNLAVAPSFAASFLPDVIVRFSIQYPGVRLHIHDVLAETCIELVRSGAVDLALTAKADEMDDLVQQDVLRDPLVVLCTNAHPIARQKTVSWNDVYTCDHISRKGASNVRQLIDQEYRRQGLVFRPAFEVENVGTMMGLVRAGLGIGIFAESTVRSFNMAGLICRPFRFSSRPYRIICATTQRSRSDDHIADAFVDMCRAKAKAMRR
ncbi:LysR family transcriptional regulator [Allopusillimonas soli]|uniref:LysR family transcriptional regulator n=1 Tax=Allopusillimonas soli TaxID=659016 RepID=A0A853F6B3_9BURK|nr:LysR family transcriptional regulator [Allopusillimonas soli]NYT36105.1 LysR family transcriptional regulator [Allopusillimonas soli]TEA76441.1 LysR family transcriptional regulator [Allopusillimonas soli]